MQIFLCQPCGFRAPEGADRELGGRVVIFTPSKINPVWGYFRMLNRTDIHKRVNARNERPFVFGRSVFMQSRSP